MQTSSLNLLYFCNASIPGDANLNWRADSLSVPFINSSRFTNRSNLSLADIDSLCEAPNHEEVFSIRFKNSYSTDASGATFLSQEIALVICHRYRSQLSTSVSYTCYSSSDSSVNGPTILLQPLPSTSFHITAIVIPIVIIIVLLLLVLVVVLVIVYLRYSRLKAEPPRMCPIGSSATASLIAGTLAPFGLEPIENIVDTFEFPRENLHFEKVLG